MAEIVQRDNRGRWITRPPGGAPPITSDTARDMIRKREEKRMRLYQEGAQLAVQDVALIQQYGQDAHLVERARTMQEIASTPDAGKAAVLAAQHLDRAQGYDMGKQADTVGQVGQVGDRLQAIVLLLLADADMGAPSVIEGAVTDAEDGAEGDGE